MKPFAVVTVHGTWARAAPWTRNGSELHVRLRSEFEEAVHTHEFNWSGQNSWVSRSEASRALSQFLSAEFGSNSTPYFLIAHSHGGNVALGAITSSLVRKPEGVICLNTPFLQPVFRSAETTTRFAYALSAPLMLGVVYLYFYLNFLGIHFGSVLAVAAGSFLAVRLPMLACRGLVDRGDVDRFISGWYEKPRILDQRILCLHSMDDEPADLMRLLRSTSDLIFHLMVHIRGWVFALLLMLLAFAAFKGWLFPSPVVDAAMRRLAHPVAATDASFNLLLLWRRLDLGAGIQLSVAVAYEYLAWATAGAAVLALLLSWVADRAIFGLSTNLAALVFPLRGRLLVGAAPPAGIIEVVYLDQVETKRGSLRHSEIYSNPDALAYAWRWMRSRLADRDNRGSEA